MCVPLKLNIKRLTFILFQKCRVCVLSSIKAAFFAHLLWSVFEKVFVFGRVVFEETRMVKPKSDWQQGKSTSGKPFCQTALVFSFWARHLWRAAHGKTKHGIAAGRGQALQVSYVDNSFGHWCFFFGRVASEEPRTAKQNMASQLAEDKHCW